MLVNADSLVERIYNSTNYSMITGHYNTWPFHSNLPIAQSLRVADCHAYSTTATKAKLIGSVNPPGFSIEFAFFSRRRAEFVGNWV